MQDHRFVSADFSGAPCLIVRADVDIASAPAFEAELSRIISGSRTVVADLRVWQYIDSTALGVLVRVSKRLPDGLRVMSTGSSPARILNITGPDAEFARDDSTADAVEPAG